MFLYIPLAMVRKTEKFDFMNIFTDIMCIIAVIMVIVFSTIKIQATGFKHFDPITHEFSVALAYTVFGS